MSGKSPRLTLRIAAYMAVALLFMAGFVLWYVHHNASADAEAEVAGKAVFVTQVLLGENELRQSDFRNVVSPSRQRALDRVFSHTGPLKGFVRANLMSRAGLVTYSTYHPLIGRIVSDPRAASQQALAGDSVHAPGRLRDQFGNETGQKILRSDLPIRLQGSAPFGVIELVQDYGLVTGSTNQTVYPVAGFLLIALISLYLALIPILRRVTAAVEVRNRRLVQQAATLERSLAAAREARNEAEAARRAMAEQNKRLRELDRLKDEFLSLVSHELRTPLTSIRGYLDLVLDEEAGELNTEQRRFLEAVERNSGRLLRLVGDLLFVAQADAGRLSLEPTKVDLAELAADCVEGAAPAAAAKSIDLVLAAQAVPAFVGDRVRLAQVLDNLVSNALKFTPEGGRVEVSTKVNGDLVLVEVTDNGIGIPVADQPRLFERFFRSSVAEEQAIPGTGLGLAIVKAIVEAHKGEIRVESTEGRGTTFRVDLPLTAEAEKVQEAA
jgi:signal transduction histidine kinase